MIFKTLDGFENRKGRVPQLRLFFLFLSIILNSQVIPGHPAIADK